MHGIRRILSNFSEMRPLCFLNKNLKYVTCFFGAVLIDGIVWGGLARNARDMAPRVIVAGCANKIGQKSTAILDEIYKGTKFLDQKSKADDIREHLLPFDIREHLLLLSKVKEQEENSRDLVCAAKDGYESRVRSLLERNLVNEWSIEEALNAAGVADDEGLKGCRDRMCQIRGVVVLGAAKGGHELILRDLLKSGPIDANSITSLLHEPSVYNENIQKILRRYYDCQNLGLNIQIFMKEGEIDQAKMLLAKTPLIRWQILNLLITSIKSKNRKAVNAILESKQYICLEDFDTVLKRAFASGDRGITNAVFESTFFHKRYFAFPFFKKIFECFPEETCLLLCAHAVRK